MKSRACSNGVGANHPGAMHLELLLNGRPERQNESNEQQPTPKQVGKSGERVKAVREYNGHQNSRNAHNDPAYDERVASSSMKPFPIPKNIGVECNWSTEHQQ